jgi:hypothetical protein
MLKISFLSTSFSEFLKIPTKKTFLFFRETMKKKSSIPGRS